MYLWNPLEKRADVIRPVGHAMPLTLDRHMSPQHIDSAVAWLSDKDIGATAMVNKMYTANGPVRCTLTVWMEKTSANQYEEKRRNCDFVTDSCR